MAISPITESFPFKNLPREIQREILEHCDIRDLFSLSKVSKYCKALTEHKVEKVKRAQNLQKSRDTLIVGKELAAIINQPFLQCDIYGASDEILHSASQFDQWFKDHLSQLNAITEIDLSFFNLGIEITSIPDQICQLPNLKKILSLYNKIRSLPDSFGNLTSLKSLVLPGNDLRILPDSFGNLSSLKILNLEGNPLQSVPDSFSNLLSTLREIDISKNQLELFPRKIHDDFHTAYFMTNDEVHLRRKPTSIIMATLATLLGFRK